MTETILLSSVLLVLSIGILLLSKNNYSLQKSNRKLNDENIKLKTKLEEAEEIMSIDPGDTAIIPNYGLSYREQNISFEVDYEVEIVEVSEKKVKVKATGFKPHCKVGKDPSNRNGIIDFMQDKWINKREIELIVDNATRRDAKLKKLGI